MKWQPFLSTSSLCFSNFPILISKMNVNCVNFHILYSNIIRTIERRIIVICTVCVNHSPPSGK